MEKLNFLIGSWTTNGKIIDDGQGQAGMIAGTDSYEWTLNGKFILHKVNVLMNAEIVEAIEFIGPGGKAGGFKLRSFDSQGIYTEMDAYLNADGSLHILADKMRSRLRVINSNRMIAYWENSTDNLNWKPWMEIELTK